MNKRIKVIKGTHGFLIRIVDDTVRKFVLNFSRNLAEFEEVYDQKTRTKTVKVKDVYATATADRNEFGFLLKDLEPMLKYLAQEGVTSDHIEFINEDQPKYADADIKVRPKVAPRDKEQELVIDFITEPNKRNRVLELRTGGGKAQPLYSKIKIPGGWTTMGQIAAGDEITLWDGSTSTVVAKHPQGVRPIYEVIFSGGRRTHCDVDHLWQFCINGKWEVMTTAVAIAALSTGVEMFNLLPRLPDEDVSERDLAMYADVDRNRTRSTLLQLESIKYVGEEEAACIEVDADSMLYVTDDFIVTHNTFAGYYSTAIFKRRTAFIMSSTHIATWMRSDWVTDVNLQTEAILLQGSDSIEAAIALAGRGEFNYKYVFITIDTYRNYLNEYLESGEDMDGVTPWNFLEHLGVGMKIVDEAHEKIKANIHTAIYSNVDLTLYLSATLKTDNKKQLEQYAKIFPKEDTFQNGRRNDHIRAISSMYMLKDHRKAKTQGFKGYSHTKYETWLLADKKRKENYFAFIWSEIEFGLLEDYQKGQKALLFFALTKTCDAFVEWMKPKLKPLKFTAAVFYSGIKESELYDHDIVVSTPGSAGTGRDIENLKVAIATVAISSVQRNLQMLGRPREMVNYPGEFPYYIWLTCKNIQKHKDYDRSKRVQYLNDVKSIAERNTGHVI